MNERKAATRKRATPPTQSTPVAKTGTTSRAPRGRAHTEAAMPQDRAMLQRLLATLGKVELTELLARLVGGWRRELQVLSEARERSYAGLQAVVKRQTEQIAEAAGELRSVGRVMKVAGPAESVRQLDALAAAALQLALNDVRELARLAASSQREAFELVQQRIAENVDAVQRLLRR